MIPWTAACQAFLSISNFWSLLKLIVIELVMPSNHLILCCPLLLLPSIFPSIRIFSNESDLCNRWPKCWRFSFIISPSNEYLGLTDFLWDWLVGSLCNPRDPQESSPTPQIKSINPYTQELNPGLLHCRQTIYQLSYQGSPKFPCMYV